MSLVETYWYLDEVDKNGDIISSCESEDLNASFIEKIAEHQDTENFVVLYLERTRYPSFSLKVYRDYIMIKANALPEKYTNGAKLKIPEKYKRELADACSKHPEVFDSLFAQALPDWNAKVNIGATGAPEYKFKKRMWINLEKYTAEAVA